MREFFEPHMAGNPNRTKRGVAFRIERIGPEEMDDVARTPLPSGVMTPVGSLVGTRCLRSKPEVLGSTGQMKKEVDTAVRGIL